jgi:hypothetical protein
LRQQARALETQVCDFLLVGDDHLMEHIDRVTVPHLFAVGVYDKYTDEAERGRA